jgi:hypothetical protein
MASGLFTLVASAESVSSDEATICEEDVRFRLELAFI